MTNRYRNAKFNEKLYFKVKFNMLILSASQYIISQFTHFKINLCFYKNSESKILLKIKLISTGHLGSV